MINGQSALRQKSKSIVNFEMLNFQFAPIRGKNWAGGKPGIGNHLPGEKAAEDISKMRMIPKGTDALSPALL